MGHGCQGKKMDSLNFNSHPKAYVVEEGLLKGQSHEIDLFYALKTRFREDFRVYSAKVANFSLR